MVKQPWEIDGNIENWEYVVLVMGSRTFEARFFELRSGAEAYAESRCKGFSESVDKGQEQGIVVMGKILYVTTRERIPADRLRTG